MLVLSRQTRESVVVGDSDRVEQPIHLSWCDMKAFFKSLWVMGLLSGGRREYWKFLTKALLHHRRAFTEAMTLAILGYHFRRVAAAL